MKQNRGFVVYFHFKTKARSSCELIAASLITVWLLLLHQVSICLECNSSKLRGLKRKWIRCSAQATVLHLKKFIAKKLNLTSFNEVNTPPFPSDDFPLTIWWCDFPLVVRLPCCRGTVGNVLTNHRLLFLSFLLPRTFLYPGCQRDESTAAPSRLRLCQLRFGF